ncbi:MAG: nucleoside recognition protein [Deltaproteobacteria bacterium]|nr:nucleoside recognition protein [Deltaproteobacteria bacterium]MBW2129489.1 nucleoside recognition protein [Deltaproteobacteria bacterium]
MKKISCLPYVLVSLLAVAAFAGLLAGALPGGVSLQDLRSFLDRVVRPLLRLTLFISAGLAVGYFVEMAGWTDRISVMARPIMKWGHLDHHVGAAFTTAFFSGTSSISMLMSFYREGKIERKQVIVGVLLNTFPSFFLHLPTTFFILVPLAGRAGALYLGLTFGAALLRLAAVLFYGRFFLPKPGRPFHNDRERKQRDWYGLLLELRKKFLNRLLRVMVIVLPVYCVIMWISGIGFFEWVRKGLAKGIGSALIPVDAMSIIIVSLAAEFTSGYAAAGAMLDSGTLNVSQTVLALLVGNIVAAPVRAFRHQMPVYIGVFGPGLGGTLMFATQAFRLISLIAVGTVFLGLVSAQGALGG